MSLRDATLKKKSCFLSTARVIFVVYLSCVFPSQYFPPFICILRRKTSQALLAVNLCTRWTRNELFFPRMA